MNKYYLQIWVSVVEDLIQFEKEVFFEKVIIKSRFEKCKQVEGGDKNVFSRGIINVKVLWFQEYGVCQGLIN